MRSVRILTLVLVVASLALVGRGLVANRGDADASPQVYGFNDLAWTNAKIPHAVTKAELAKAHASYYRFAVSWQYFEPVEGQPSQGYLPFYYDAYQQLLANGQTPVFVVLGTPYWALTAEGKGASKGQLLCADNHNTTTCNAPPDVRDPHILDRWKLFLQILAWYMPKAVFEIWNEPNIDWDWMQPQDPELYGLMLKSAYEAIKSISPTTKVISGSVNNYEGKDTSLLTGDASFLRQMYASAGKDSFDALGFHAYPCNQLSTPDGWVQGPQHTIAAVRAARDAAGDTAKPLWLTEYGANTGGPDAGNCYTFFSEQQQADALGAMTDWAKQQNDSYHDLPVALIHTLFDNAARKISGTDESGAPQTVVGSPQNEFGLIYYTIDPSSGAITLHPKPALATVTCKFASTC